MPKKTFYNLNQEKQEIIMRTAIDEFLNKGFEKGNIGNIAKNAGIAKGSMYQYFENKKELFLFSVYWASDIIIKKYDTYSGFEDKNMNIFDYIYERSKVLWFQIKDEKELIIFLQNVSIGKYISLKDEAMQKMLELSNNYVLSMIRAGKEHGYIRKDMDDDMLLMFLTGASMKIKEYLFKKYDNLGKNIIDENFEEYKKQSKALIELLKNGMGVK